jgi:hypothetical protein
MRFKSYRMVVVGTVFLLGITSCSGGDGIAAIDRDATSEDQLPPYVMTPNLKLDSVRRVAEQDEVTYFISKLDEDNGFCVIRTRGQDETAWGTGCGTGTGRVITNSTTGISEAVTLVTDGYATDDLEKDGWTKISENLLIR